MPFEPEGHGQAPSASLRRRVDAAVILLVAVSAFGAFVPAVRGTVLDFDDRAVYADSPAIREISGRSLAWMFSSTQLGHYAPLAWLSVALDVQIHGGSARGFHLTNLLLHAVNAALFYFLALRLIVLAQPERANAHPVLARIAAGFAACFFAVHPLRTESVAWLTERRGLLGAALLLPAVLAWLRACAPGRPELRSRGWYAASIVLLAASVLAKGLGMTFVAVAVVLDVYPLRRLPPNLGVWWKPGLRGVWLQKLPLLAIAVASASLSNWAARSAPHTMATLEQWGVGARLAQACYGLVFYAWKTVWPSGLTPMHELPWRFDAGETRFVVSMIAAVVLVAGVFVLRRRWPWLAAAAAVYAISLAPVLGFNQAGPQLVAERYSYVACMPWAILLGGGLLQLWRRARPLAGAVSGVAVLALLGGLFVASRRQTLVWRDDQSLWTHALAVGPPSSFAHNCLGAVEYAQGRTESAVAHFRKAVEIRPDQGVAWFDLGLIYTYQGRLADAERAFLEAKDNMTPAYKPLVALGKLYMERMNRVDDALRVLREAMADMNALGFGWFSPVPHLVIGQALGRKGDREQARRHLQFAAQFPETREEALRDLARMQ